MIDLIIEALLAYFLLKPSQKTKKIAILGIKGSGKTTLWNGLRDKNEVEYVTTHYQEIDEFSIKSGKGKVTISSTKDIGGGDLYVPYYNELIEDGTFIYFLVDINTIKENKDAIRMRLRKIFNMIKGESGEDGKKDCGFKILVTHTDVFFNNNLNRMPKAQLIEYVSDGLELATIKGLPRDMAKRIETVNLNSPNDIKTIKDEIIHR